MTKIVAQISFCIVIMILIMGCAGTEEDFLQEMATPAEPRETPPTPPTPPTPVPEETGHS